MALAKERGAKRALPLPVSAPFHSPLMRAGARGPGAATSRPPSSAIRAVPVVANIDAAPVTTGAAARDALVRQIDGPVRWVESVRTGWREHGVETLRRGRARATC